MPDRCCGTVKWFNVAKGIGFIGRDTGEDVFVNLSALRQSGCRPLNEGERVSFLLAKSHKGLHAEDVRLA